MSNEIKQQVIAAIGQFSLQLDESTYVSDDAQLMAYTCSLSRCKRRERGVPVLPAAAYRPNGATMSGTRRGFTARVKEVIRK